MRITSSHGTDSLFVEPPKFSNAQIHPAEQMIELFSLFDNTDQRTLESALYILNGDVPLIDKAERSKVATFLRTYADLTANGVTAYRKAAAKAEGDDEDSAAAWAEVDDRHDEDVEDDKEKKTAAADFPLKDKVALNSAILEAQRRIEEKEGKGINAYAVPIMLRGVDQAIENGATSIQEVLDTQFYGRLRGSLITILKSRGYKDLVR